MENCYKYLERFVPIASRNVSLKVNVWLLSLSKGTLLITNIAVPAVKKTHLGMNCLNRKIINNDAQSTRTWNKSNNRDKTFTFTNLPYKFQNNHNAGGAIPKCQFIEDCQLCGKSQYEGNCYGEFKLIHSTVISHTVGFTKDKQNYKAQTKFTNITCDSIPDKLNPSESTEVANINLCQADVEPLVISIALDNNERLIIAW